VIAWTRVRRNKFEILLPTGGRPGLNLAALDVGQLRRSGKVQLDVDGDVSNASARTCGILLRGDFVT
jgi:hypothetical protein